MKKKKPLEQPITQFTLAILVGWPYTPPFFPLIYEAQSERQRIKARTRGGVKRAKQGHFLICVRERERQMSLIG